MARKDPDKYLGRWKETPFERLSLPWTFGNLRTVLSHGAENKSEYTHQQIADWCARLWWECTEGSLSEKDDEKLKAAADIAQDVDAQWGIFLVNTYSLKELQSMYFGSVRLPREWFQEWCNELDNIAL